MPYIQLNEIQFPLRFGETSVGTAGADIPIEGPPALGVQARLHVSSDNSVAIRRASSEAMVRVNGVQLGAEPTPLIHGDKIDVGGRELLYGDDKKGGQTQYLTGLKIPEGAEAVMPSSTRPAGTTGGRLVSLVDGREYSVSPTGVTIGRDAGCDVVVPSPEVSRKHAELAGGAGGYTVTDLSTNGVFVNGERVKTSRTLSRGDVLRVGTEEFRFYADVTPPASPVPAGGSPQGQRAPVATPRPVAAAGHATPAAPHPPSPGAASASTPPAAPAGDARPVLATLEIMNEGPSKGKRFELRVPLLHVGRGAHNDIVLPDDSVSDSHAKLQKRESGWYVVDMGSTNGTYCGGQRIAGESSLSGVVSLRFGGIRASFAPAAETKENASGTRMIAGISVEHKRKLSREPAGPAPAPIESETRAGVPGWAWLLVLALIAAGALFILKVR